MSKKEDKNYFENDIVAENIEKLYLTSKAANVYFIFRSRANASERIPAHTNLLAATSDVFDAMFYGELKEKGEVEIPDATPSAFKEFLQFFYKTKIELTEENVFDVMDLGNRYNVAKCTDACVHLLKKTLTNESMCNGLAVALLYENADLLRFCRRRIAMNAEKVFETEGFLECKQQVLAYILKMQTLYCSESKVFRACVSWVKAQSGGENVVTREAFQTHLGELFHEIRFASMTVEEFTILFSSFGSIISQAEYVDIIQMIVLAKETTLPNINHVPRQAEWKSDAVIKCDRTVLNAIGFQHDMREIETVRFYTNEPVLLGHFTCAQIIKNRFVPEPPPLTPGYATPVEIQIIESFASSRACPNLESVIKFNLKTRLKSESETVVSLPKPLVIRPHCQYDILLKADLVASEDFKLKYNCPRLEHDMHIGSDIVLHFNDEADQYGTYYTPITKFEFNHI